MSLQEMEDSTSCSSQIFLNADGTVTFGATDGPPPLGGCGLWQCGVEGFQMNLQRTFPVSGGGINLLEDGPTYSVTRLYRGEVNKQSVSGLKIIEGRIDLYEGEPEDALPPPPTNVGTNAWSGEVLSGATAAAAIGYFSLDKADVELFDPDEAKK